MRLSCFAGNYIIIIAYASVVSSFNAGSLQDYVQPAVEERSSGKVTLNILEYPISCLMHLE